uniref:Uncharacterized protein n=1 Tax=Anthurium amnicola TaxID=1678845 RepID=A0A1D1XS63_9ARAE
MVLSYLSFLSTLVPLLLYYHPYPSSRLSILVPSGYLPNGRLLDLVRPFLGLVRPHSVVVIVILRFNSSYAKPVLGQNHGPFPYPFSLTSHPLLLSIPPELPGVDYTLHILFHEELILSWGLEDFTSTSSSLHLHELAHGLVPLVDQFF